MFFCRTSALRRRLVQAADKKKGAIGRFFGKLASPSAIALLFGWLVLFALLWYVQLSAKDLAPFDPYDILKARTALSHPTYNPPGSPQPNPAPCSAPSLATIKQCAESQVLGHSEADQGVSDAVGPQSDRTGCEEGLPSALLAVPSRQKPRPSGSPGVPGNQPSIPSPHRYSSSFLKTRPASQKSLNSLVAISSHMRFSSRTGPTSLSSPIRSMNPGCVPCTIPLIIPSTESREHFFEAPQTRGTGTGHQMLKGPGDDLQMRWRGKTGSSSATQTASRRRTSKSRCPHGSWPTTPMRPLCWQY